MKRLSFCQCFGPNIQKSARYSCFYLEDLYLYSKITTNFNPNVEMFFKYFLKKCLFSTEATFFLSMFRAQYFEIGPIFLITCITFYLEELHPYSKMSTNFNPNVKMFFKYFLKKCLFSNEATFFLSMFRAQYFEIGPIFLITCITFYLEELYSCGNVFLNIF